MYEVNKNGLFIEEKKNAHPHSKHFVMVGKYKEHKNNTHCFYAQTLEEAQAKLAELVADEIKYLEDGIKFHENQIEYHEYRISCDRRRLAAILKEHHPDAGKVIDEKKPG